jgi:hypothetical protein
MSDVLGGLTNQINMATSTSDSIESLPVDSVSNETKKSNFESKSSNSVRKSVVKMAANSAAMVAGGVGGLAREGMKTAEIATKGALKGMMEAKRTLELLTFGEYYRISSTAFVTFRSRVAKCTSHQMLLSHHHLTLYVRSAPNPNDIIWDNVSIPLRQVRTRRMIADVTLIVGAIFFFTFIVITILFHPFMFLKKHGRRHALMGLTYLVWLIIGFCDILFRESYFKRIIYDAILGILGVALTLTAIADFQHKNINSRHIEGVYFRMDRNKVYRS